MKITYVAILILVFVMSGCSFYDVAANTVDAAFGRGLFSDKDSNVDDWDGLWDPKISQCIRDEKQLRPLLLRLDAMKEDKKFVILPTGEKYPVEERLPSGESLAGPTATCLSRTSD